MKDLITKWLSLSSYIHSLLRIVASFMFMTIGLMKLVAFPVSLFPNGGTVHIFSELGLAGILEAFGGFMLLIGLYTRPVAFILAGEMAVAYFQSHSPQGFWPMLNGGQPAILYCFIWLYLSSAGAGALSIDEWRKKKISSKFFSN